MMKAHEGGFILFWTKANVADASRCLDNVGKHKNDQIRLTIGGLSGSFILLAFGSCLSVIVFVLEMISITC